MRLYKIAGLSFLLAAVFTVVTVYAVSVEEIHTSQAERLSTETTSEPIAKDPQVETRSSEGAATKTNEEPVSKEVEIKPGDTLARIAQDHNVTYARLFSANEHIEHPDLIEPGDTVRIPADGEELPHRDIPEPASEPNPDPDPDPTPAPQPASTDANSVWDQLAQCESGGRWSLDSTYDGGLQFHPDTWNRHKPAGYPAYAWQATREQQIEVGKSVQASGGWDQWPHCSAELGLG